MLLAQLGIRGRNGRWIVLPQMSDLTLKSAENDCKHAVNRRVEHRISRI